MLDFISRISIVCFAASYAVALACEVSRLLFRSGVRGAVMVGFTIAGLIAHTAFLAWRATSESAVPLSSPFDWYLIGAWLLAISSLALTVTKPRLPIGLFIMPFVLSMIGIAALSSREAFPQSLATQIWGVIHGSFILAASLAVVVGAIASVMWLFQAGRLARKQMPMRGFQMPSLERLSHTSMYAMEFAAWTALAGFVSGIVLNALNRQQDLSETVPWNDPVVLRMAMLVSWLTIAAMTARIIKRRPGGARLVVWFSLVSFTILTGSILWGVFGETRHGVPPSSSHIQNEVAP